MIAYLTKVEISYETAVKCGLRDSYAWHQKTWEAFPDRVGEDRDFLTRLDDTDSGFRLLILSETLPVRPDWCPSGGWQKPKKVDASFLQHGTYQFSLLANATEKKVVREEDGSRRKNGKRIPIVGEENLVRWLQRKAAQHGFEIAPTHLKATPMPRQYFVKKGKTGLHVATNFQGVLRITDHDLFTQSLTKGIGTAKAFGFGMLCLSPA